MPSLSYAARKAADAAERSAFWNKLATEQMIYANAPAADRAAALQLAREAQDQAQYWTGEMLYWRERL